MSRKIEKIIREICGKNYSTQWDELNYKKIPVTLIPAMQGEEVKFNELYKALKESNFKQIIRTESGGISNTLQERRIFDKYDVRQMGACVEITVCTFEKCARVQFRIPNYKADTDEKLITAGEYFRKYWIPYCNKHGIDMKKYACTKAEGLEYKKQIHTSDINIYDPAASYGEAYEDAHHLDFHKFYMSGLVHALPEFKPVVDEIMAKIADAKAKGDNTTIKYHKTGLAAMIGYFQSACCGYKYAKLSMIAINDAYARFDIVKENLQKAGRRLLATNTDGIWYSGEIYHGEFEGTELTQWENDHTDCIIRFKSAGSYEYIEDGEYYPIVRGRTRLDKILSREDWDWGDIFQTDVITWKFDEEEGIVWYQ